MLLENLGPGRASQQAASAPPESYLNVGDLLRLLRRQWILIAGAALVFLAAAVAYLLITSPKYTATTAILMDTTHKPQAFQTQQAAVEPPLDSSTIESQAEILHSDGVLLPVIRKLDLTNDPDIMGRPSLLGRIVGLLSSDDGPPTRERLEQTAVEYFAKNLQVKRVGLTYVIEASVITPDAAKSAAIANAIAASYLNGELDARFQVATRAANWMHDRIGELREQARVADTAVEAFKSTNRIVDTGGKGLINEQQVGDMNAQLTAARGAVSETKARLDRIQSLAASNIPDATVTDALRSDVITRLRQQYLDLSNREAELTSRVGPNHEAVINARNQMREIRRSLTEELGRIAETYKSDYQIAQAREKALEASLSILVDQSSVVGQAQTKLRDLSAVATSYRTLYDGFLQRAMETTQQQSFPISDARVITPAAQPLRKSAPKSTLILAGALVAGLSLGCGIAFLREQLDDVYRNAAQIEQALGIECLGILPEIKGGKVIEGDASDPRRRTIQTMVGVNRHVVEAPFSRFAETLRHVKVAIDIVGLARVNQVVGITSALAGEGKTTVSTNLAQLLAQSGQRTIVIDADLRHPALTGALAPGATVGLVEVLSGLHSEAEAIWTDPATGLHILPSVITERISHTADLISSPAMANLFVRLRERYDHILLDLPPCLPVVDVKASSHLVDGFLFVVEWGKTSRDIVREAMTSVEMLSERSIGSVLNKANVAQLRRLEHGKTSSYNAYYSG